jgi:hypothetical protein
VPRFCPKCFAVANIDRAHFALLVERLTCRPHPDFRMANGGMLIDVQAVGPAVPREDHLEREAHRENPAMVVLVELRRGDLHTAADSKPQSLRDLKHAEDNPGGQECFLLA